MKLVVTFKSFKVHGPDGVSVAPILSFVSAKVFEWCFRQVFCFIQLQVQDGKSHDCN